VVIAELSREREAKARSKAGLERLPALTFTFIGAATEAAGGLSDRGGEPWSG